MSAPTQSSAIAADSASTTISLAKESSSTEVENNEESGGFLIKTGGRDTDSYAHVKLLCDSFQMITHSLPTKEHRKQINSITKTLDSSLVRLDELGPLVQSLQSTCDDSNTDTIPELRKRRDNILNAFQKIDRIHNYMKRLDAALSAIEERTEKVETLLPQEESIVNSFFSFLDNKKAFGLLPPWSPLDQIPQADALFGNDC